MGSINRSAVILRAKSPCLEWQASVSDFSIEDLLKFSSSQEPVVYLVRENEDSHEAVIKKEWSHLFESELFGWVTDETMWPQDRNLRMFRAWFEIEVFLLVVNQVEGPVYDSEDV